MAPEAPTDLAASIRDERIRPFLPLVYLAWSDGELTSEEIEGICSAVAKHPGIDLDCQVALRHWLSPDDPPSPRELELLRLQIVTRSEAHPSPNLAAWGTAPRDLIGTVLSPRAPPRRWRSASPRLLRRRGGLSSPLPPRAGEVARRAGGGSGG